MFQIINTIVLNHVEAASQIITTLFLIVVGTPFISFKGGIPRIGNLIIKKFKSIVVAVLLGLVIMFIVHPLLTIVISFLIKTFADFTLSILAVLSGLALWEWDKKMRWDYKWYWIPMLILGVILFGIELYFAFT